MSIPPDEDAAQRLAQAWMAVWRDEFAARMADTEGMAGMLDAWTRYAQAMTRPPGERDGAARPARQTPPGTAAAGGASGPVDGTLARVLERVDALERRVAELEARPGRGGRKRGAG